MRIAHAALQGHNCLQMEMHPPSPRSPSRVLFTWYFLCQAWNHSRGGGIRLYINYRYLFSLQNCIFLYRIDSPLWLFLFFLSHLLQVLQHTKYSQEERDRYSKGANLQTVWNYTAVGLMPSELHPWKGQQGCKQLKEHMCCANPPVSLHWWGLDNYWQ